MAADATPESKSPNAPHAKQILPTHRTVRECLGSFAMPRYCAEDPRAPRGEDQPLAPTLYAALQ